jgi:glycosyltransferase involved in cell wall biosynthesis
MSKWNTIWNGYKILPPFAVRNTEYDRIFILDDSKIREYVRELAMLGVPKEKIWNKMYYNAYTQKGNIKIYNHKNNVSCNGNYKKRILFVNPVLNYNGGNIAGLYAVMALQSRGYDVVLAAPDGNVRFIDECRNIGITIVIARSLDLPNEEEMVWIRSFDLVIANTFYSIGCASRTCKELPTILWLHEPECQVGVILHTIYKVIINDYYFNVDFKPYLEDMSIYCVSNIARDIFHKYYPDVKSDIMPYSIPDAYNVKQKEHGSSKFVFAIIGRIDGIKAQDIFLKAAQLVDDKFKNQAEFWIIGGVSQKDFYQKLYDEYSNLECVKFCGGMTREEIARAYENNIDVVVCASIQETMSIVLTEAMMYAKPLITTETTGMADYVEDGVNCLICKTGDVENLCEKMEWMMVNRDKLDVMGQNARKTYEEYFTMDKFADRLEDTIDATYKSFEEGKKLCPLDNL